MVFFPSFCRPKIAEILPQDPGGIEETQRKNTFQQGESILSNSGSAGTRATTADGVVSTEHAGLGAGKFPSDPVEEVSNEAHISSPATSQCTSSSKTRRESGVRTLVHALSPSRPSSPPPADPAPRERSRTWFKVSFGSSDDELYGVCLFYILYVRSFRCLNFECNCPQACSRGGEGMLASSTAHTYMH